MKITILTAIWKRPEIVELFLEGYEILKSQIKERYPEVELSLVIARSENERLPNYVKAIDVSNDNLTTKWNTGARACEGSDYVIMLGSDDLITISAFDQYYSRMLEGIDYIYSTDFYFYDVVSGYGAYWAGYIKTHNRGDACGAGRVLSKRLMTKLGWQPWQSGFEKVLDTGMDFKMKSVSYTKKGFSLKQTNSIAIDIKSEVNMTPFERWENTVYISGKDLLYRAFPKEFANKITLGIKD